MNDEDFLRKIKEANKNYNGQMKSITFVVDRNGAKKKIFKWIFKPNNIDFYITFSNYNCESYKCGTVVHPKPGQGKTFNALANGRSSKIPVKFSYHRDGKVHFKPEERKAVIDKKYKLAEIQAVPLDQLKGDHIFTIIFEGWDKFSDYNPRSQKDGELDMNLPIPNDILNFELRAFAGPTVESVDKKIKKGVPAWAVLNGFIEGKRVFIGLYLLLSRKSHILDQNKNGLLAFVGFDHSKEKETGEVRSLYLYAR